MIKRGEIYWVQLDPVVGSEIGKVRPALVVSNDHNNELAGTVTLVPISSSTGKIYPFEVFLKKGAAGLAGDSKAKANQVRTVDKTRLRNLIGAVPGGVMELVERALKLHLDMA